ncbi:DUF1439 domain-containing protein [Oceanisphaera pacifica]|uniref:DUF1439 domain-containing protein n=1 Tax=Oceanisphaera pacifica TaxID=2818389 RepID=A0ABS3NE01_9GAMM|nr:DUF1439 domain-containing protein [Oceanisphaera pacifica]MBO1518520.1 DUF1439 domain-containing protein [Oceanisphaera pacifica]
MKVILLFMMLSVSAWAGAQTLTLTERQLNTELNQQLGKSFPVNLGPWLSAAIKMQDMQIMLGRQSPDKASVMGDAFIEFNQGQQQYHWHISGNFSARPRYDNEAGALFLDEFDLISYRLNQDESAPQARFILPILLQGLTGYLSKYPVYTLDEQVPLQRQIKESVVSLAISPGKISLHGIN